MPPSAPSFSVPRGSTGVVSSAVSSAMKVVSSGGSMNSNKNAGDVVVPAPAFSIANGSMGSRLTRVSLHGQGLRAINGLEMCQNLEILVKKWIWF